jgi:hypothetical protein
MASFKVLQDWRPTGEDDTRFIEPGAFYSAGHTITGLTGPEAAELLRLAPEGTFEALDEEAQVMATRQLMLSGKLGSSGVLAQDDVEVE